MRHVVDAFITAVEEARRELIRSEGRDVSIRELIRRAGFPESQRAGVAYHLNPRIDRTRGHKVPPEIVRRLAAALSPHITEDELTRAAQVAAGFNVTDHPASPDVTQVVSRFYGDEAVTEEERRAVTARLMQILAEEAQRSSARSSESDEGQDSTEP